MREAEIDRKTEKDRETEIDRQTERERDRDTESKRDRESDDGCIGHIVSQRVRQVETSFFFKATIIIEKHKLTLKTIKHSYKAFLLKKKPKQTNKIPRELDCLL